MAGLLSLAVVTVPLKTAVLLIAATVGVTDILKDVVASMAKAGVYVQLTTLPVVAHDQPPLVNEASAVRFAGSVMEAKIGPVVGPPPMFVKL